MKKKPRVGREGRPSPRRAAARPRADSTQFGHRHPLGGTEPWFLGLHLKLTQRIMSVVSQWTHKKEKHDNPRFFFYKLKYVSVQSTMTQSKCLYSSIRTNTEILFLSQIMVFIWLDSTTARALPKDSAAIWNVTEEREARVGAELIDRQQLVRRHQGGERVALVHVSCHGQTLGSRGLAFHKGAGNAVLNSGWVCLSWWHLTISEDNFDFHDGWGGYAIGI